ncbi:MAG: ABC transporter permease [Phycisphaerales bacterium]|nr:ABC transporter permease [Phycisphaerales bacterium]
MRQLTRQLREGFYSIRVHKLRSYLSVLGIVFGVASVVAMLSVVEGARNDVLERLARLGSNAVFVMQSPSSKSIEGVMATRQLQLRDAKRLLTSTESKQLVAPAYVMESSGRTNTIVAGVTPEYFIARQLRVQAGRGISALDQANGARVCVIGADISSKHDNVSVGGTIELQGVAFTVVGVLTSEKSVHDRSLGSLLRNHGTFALIPITSLQQPMAIPHGEIPLTEMTVRMATMSGAQYTPRVIRNILENGRAIPPAHSVVVPRQLLRQEQHAQHIFAIVVGCVALIGVLIGGIGVMNIMLANVAQRCHEIGIRRAIGATQKQIATLFLIESILLTLFGGVGGTLLGLAGSVAIAFFGGWPISITVWSIGVALSMAGLVGILAGYYPAIRAAKLDPVDALRHE